MREELERREAARKEIEFEDESEELDNLLRWQRGQPGATRPAPDAQWRLTGAPAFGRARRRFERNGRFVRYDEHGRHMPNGRPFDPLYNVGDEQD